MYSSEFVIRNDKGKGSVTSDELSVDEDGGNGRLTGEGTEVSLPIGSVGDVVELENFSVGVEACEGLLRLGACGIASVEWEGGSGEEEMYSRGSRSFWEG